MAAIADLASTPSKINSVATIFAPDVYNKIGEPKSSSPAFNIGSAGPILVLIALYTSW